MAIIKTDVWLEEYLNNRKRPRAKLHRKMLCEKLLPYFHGVDSYAIQDHLIQHGLFLPDADEEKLMEFVQEKKHWKLAALEWKQLRTEWQGPDIPIFIFPSDSHNKRLQTELNGKSGLAYQDKVLLFVAPDTSRLELQALLTHEYNHVCRLHYLNQQEETIELLDSIILEGLAERAVHEKLGTAYTAKWTSIYTAEEAEKHWKRWIKPNLSMKKANFRHDYLMYGKGRIPRWLGYNVGCHLVASFAEQTAIPMQELLQTPAETMLEGSEFS